MTSHLDQRLAEIRERNEKRTQGKWETWVTGDPRKPYDLWSGNVRTKERSGSVGQHLSICRCHTAATGESDADFIAHAPDDVTLLLEVVEKLKEVVADCKHTLQWYKSSPEWVQGSIELCDETLADLDRLAGGGK